jgi:hypothetical protein
MRHPNPAGKTGQAWARTITRHVVRLAPVRSEREVAGQADRVAGVELRRRRLGGVASAASPSMSTIVSIEFGHAQSRPGDGGR